MKTLADLHKQEQLKEKRNKSILIISIVVLTICLISLFFIDPWEIAYNKENKRIAERQDEFKTVLYQKLDEGDYLGAFYLDSELDLYDVDSELYILLSNAEDVITTGRNIVEDKADLNYEDLDSLVDSFYGEYFYLKKYGNPSNYIEDIKEDVENFLLAYDLMSSEEISLIKENN